MRSRLARLGVVAFGLLALLGTTTPAKADTVLAAAFIANVTVTDGIGYPVTTLPTPTNGNVLSPLDGYTLLETLAHAKGARHVCNLPLPNGFLDDPECLTNSHWVYDHPRTISASQIECDDVSVNIDKLTKAPGHVGACVFTTVTGLSLKPNIITGHCGQSSGQIQVIFTNSLGQDFHLDLHFKTAATVVLISGHWYKLGSPQHGLIVSVGLATPVIVVGGPSCTNKTQEDFIVVGTALAVSDPNL